MGRAQTESEDLEGVQSMNTHSRAVVVAAAIAAADVSTAAAVTTEDFAMQSAQDLVDLCGEPAIDAVMRLATESWPCATQQPRSKSK
jgi:hypothetical protein